MTPEAQRIAIAEACGWTNIDSYLGREPLPFTRVFLGGTDDGLAEGGDTLGHEIKRVPDYLNDLNAMHEAEKILGDDEAVWHGYKFWLLSAIEPKRHELHATAAQRAEAFLRTIGKWEDDK